MRAPVSGLDLEALPGAVPAWRARCERGPWLAAAERIAAGGGRLAALWASDERDAGGGFAAHALFATFEGLLWLELAVAEAEGYPDLSAIFPGARRMQRAAFDMTGVRARGAADLRKWLRHGAWPAEVFPLRKEFAAQTQFPGEADRYPFVRVEGDGVHEIAVGPVHA